MRALHQQLSHVRIPFLGDAQLRPAIARLSPPGPQSEVGAGIPAPAESMRVVHRQHIRQCGQGPHSVHLLQQLYLPVRTLPPLLGLFVVLPDALPDGLYLSTQSEMNDRGVCPSTKASPLCRLGPHSLAKSFSVVATVPSARTSPCSSKMQ